MGKENSSGRPRQCPPCPECGADAMRSDGRRRYTRTEGKGVNVRYGCLYKSYYTCKACGAKMAWRILDDSEQGRWEMVAEKQELTVKEVMLADIRKKLPNKFFTRREAEIALDGMLSYDTLRKLDEKGVGPKSAKNGGRVMYEKDAFVKWIDGRIEDTNNPTSG